MSPPPMPPLTLLLVEDDPLDVYLLQRVLTAQELSYTLHVTDNSEQALERCAQLAAHAGGRAPTVVLLDLHLPQGDGKEVLRRLQALPPEADLRVIVVTGSHNPADRREVLQMGAAAYFVKPFDLQEFMHLGRLIHAVAQGHGQDGLAP
jgi:CheY-like chemotaxis protein